MSKHALLQDLHNHLFMAAIHIGFQAQKHNQQSHIATMNT